MSTAPAPFMVKPASSAGRTSLQKNAMSVDVEDYFQVQALAGQFPRADWDRQTLRVEANTHLILDIFAENDVKATFFTLGWVASRCPGLIRRIVAEGHELASHGSEHRRADEQNREQFRQDVGGAKALLEDLGGVAVRGYRAPSFSINEANLWAFEVLAESGYRYSSSVYPVKRDFYGMPSAPRVPFFPTQGGTFEEYPISTVRFGGRNLPAGGGGFFRLLPLMVTRAAIKLASSQAERPCIFYLHPWELDPGQPRPDNIPLKSRFRHYVNLAATEGRLRRLSREFSWGRLDDVFEAPK